MLKQTVQLLLACALIGCSSVHAFEPIGTVTHSSGVDVTVIEDYNRASKYCKNVQVMGYYTVVNHDEPIVVMCEKDKSTLVHELTHANQDLRDGKADMELTYHPDVPKLWLQLSAKNHPLTSFIKAHYPANVWFYELEAYLSEQQ